MTVRSVWQRTFVCHFGVCVRVTFLDAGLTCCMRSVASIVHVKWNSSGPFVYLKLKTLICGNEHANKPTWINEWIPCIVHHMNILKTCIVYLHSVRLPNPIDLAQLQNDVTLGIACKIKRRFFLRNQNFFLKLFNKFFRVVCVLVCGVWMFLLFS